MAAVHNFRRITGDYHLLHVLFLDKNTRRSQVFIPNKTRGVTCDAAYNIVSCVPTFMAV